MSFTLQTILHIKASRAIGDTLIRLPTVSSTVRMSDGSSYSAIDELSPSHIQCFTGFKLLLLEDFHSQPSSSVVVRYQPVQEMNITVETK